MKNLWHNKIFWEVIGYCTLALSIVGQIAVGYIYIVAQFVYLAANGISAVRSFALNLPTANKTKDCTFFAITAGLIIIYFVRNA